MGPLAIGSVVLVDFPYSNYLNYKKRPALVIGLAELDNYILCQITSQKSAGRLAVKLNDQDFSGGGLSRDSYIRPDKIYTVQKTIIEHELGKLGGQKISQVKRALARILELPKIT